MNVIRFTVKWQFTLLYLDDVVAFSQTTSQNIEQIASVLRLMNSAGITVQLRKRFLFTDVVDFLGPTIHPGTLEVATKMTDAVRSFRLPTNVNELGLILGLCSVYR